MNMKPQQFLLERPLVLAAYYLGFRGGENIAEFETKSWGS